MDDQKKRMIVTIIFSILFLGTSCYFYFQKPKIKEEKKTDEIVKKETKKEEPVEETIFVDIKGEVLNPGLYEVPTNKRVMDIITAAGGLTEFADTSTINLSKKVEDQMVIIVNKIGEETKESSLQNDARIVASDALISKTNKTSTGPISINQASKEELMTLNGIGEAKAASIIDYRNQHGGFKSVEELMEVKGIGERLFQKVKDYITL